MSVLLSVLRSHNNKTRGGLGRVCATGMYRSIEHMKFPKFQTGNFVEWKAPKGFFCISSSNMTIDIYHPNKFGKRQ